MTVTSVTTESVELLGVPVELRTSGTGPPLLFLHGEDGFLFNHRLLDLLGEQFTVVAPTHPGWNGPVPAQVRTLDDVAYLYLDLLDHLPEPCAVLGVSLGAWLAAEILTKNDARATALALVSPVGIKTAGREDRSFLDLYATRADRVVSALYAQPADAPALEALSDEQLHCLATAQEAVARFAWEPYMHNPRLHSRLQRIDVPTLVVGGDRDGFVLEPDYVETFADAIGANARRVTVEGGHRLDEEAPDRIVALVTELLGLAMVPAGIQRPSEGRP